MWNTGGGCGGDDDGLLQELACLVEGARSSGVHVTHQAVVSAPPQPQRGSQRSGGVTRQALRATALLAKLAQVLRSSNGLA